MYNSGADMTSLISQPQAYAKSLKMEAQVHYCIRRSWIIVEELGEKWEPGGLPQEKLSGLLPLERQKTPFWSKGIKVPIITVSLHRVSVQRLYKLRCFICCGVSHFHTVGIYAPHSRKPLYIPFIKVKAMRISRLKTAET